MVKTSMEKEKSFGAALPGCFYGIFGRRGIVEFLKISLLLVILFGFLCSIQPLGGVQITLNSFVTTVFL